MLEMLVAALIAIGAVFVFVGSLGLVVLPDFFTRMHAPTKATTLGVGSLLLASSIYFSSRGDGISLHELAIILLLFVTAPLGAHLLSKAALHLGLPSRAPVPPTLVSESARSVDRNECGHDTDRPAQ
jgi:multicomponent K+:H+ antiporter subunit G